MNLLVDEHSAGYAEGAGAGGVAGYTGVVEGQVYGVSPTLFVGWRLITVACLLCFPLLCPLLGPVSFSLFRVVCLLLWSVTFCFIVVVSFAYLIQ